MLNLRYSKWQCLNTLTRTQSGDLHEGDSVGRFRGVSTLKTDVRHKQALVCRKSASLDQYWHEYICVNVLACIWTKQSLRLVRKACCHGQDGEEKIDQGQRFGADLFEVIYIEDLCTIHITDIRGNVPWHRDVEESPDASYTMRRLRHFCQVWPMYERRFWSWSYKHYVWLCYPLHQIWHKVNAELDFREVCCQSFCSFCRSIQQCDLLTALQTSAESFR